MPKEPKRTEAAGKRPRTSRRGKGTNKGKNGTAAAGNAITAVNSGHVETYIQGIARQALEEYTGGLLNLFTGTGGLELSSGAKINRETIDAIVAGISVTANFQTATDALMKQSTKTLEAIADSMAGWDFVQQLRELDKQFNADMEAEAREILEAAGENPEAAAAIVPRVRELLEKWMDAHPDEKSIYFSEISPLETDDGKNLFAELVKQALDELNSVAITVSRSKKTFYPIDKLNGTIWQAMPENEVQSLAAERSGSKQQVNILYSVDFDELEKLGVSISRELTDFDKRVMIVAGKAWQLDGGLTTETTIYRRMGNRGTPSKRQIRKIDDSLTKLMLTHVKISNQQEIEAGYNTPFFEYDGTLLPFERITAKVNGRITDGAIHLFREPPVLQFARERKQYTTISSEVWELDELSKTDDNIALENYMVERIAKGKHGGNKTCTIKMDKIYEKLGIDPKHERYKVTRMIGTGKNPGKVRKVLNAHQKVGNLSKYSITKDKIVVTY